MGFNIGNVLDVEWLVLFSNYQFQSILVPVWHFLLGLCSWLHRIVVYAAFIFPADPYNFVGRCMFMHAHLYAFVYIFLTILCMYVLSAVCFIDPPCVAVWASMYAWRQQCWPTHALWINFHISIYSQHIFYMNVGYLDISIYVCLTVVCMCTFIVWYECINTVYLIYILHNYWYAYVFNTIYVFMYVFVFLYVHVFSTYLWKDTRYEE